MPAVTRGPDRPNEISRNGVLPTSALVQRRHQLWEFRSDLPPYTVYSAIKRPDLVVQHALGSGAHLVIDVKTVDGTGSTAIERSHTDVSALGGLTEAERALWDEYTDGLGPPTRRNPRRHRGRRRFRRNFGILVGSFGVGALTLSVKSVTALAESTGLGLGLGLGLG